MKRALRWAALGLVVASSALATGCAPVQAWERDILARRHSTVELQATRSKATVTGGKQEA